MKRKITYLILIFLFTICLYVSVSYAGTQELSSLKYDVNLNEDGSVDVTEIWNIEVTDTNTLFKNFKIDNTKYNEITNVSIAEIKNGVRQEFVDTKQYAYHVKKGGFYALETDEKLFEIAWGVSIDGTENKKYEIKYKINDAIKNYNDCSEFYWQFVGKTNGVPARNVEGTIKLPKAVNNIEDLRVWAHGPLNGTIHKIDNETVKFEVERFSDRTMLEVRITTPNEVFANNKNIINKNKLQNILSEEQGWADEANKQREKEQKEAEMMKKTIYIGIIIVGIIMVIIYVSKIIKYVKILKKTEKINPEEDIKYFRDFPDETATAAEAAFLYYFDKEILFNSNKSKILSATLLNLALKNAIEFKEGEKEKIYIIINKNADITKLKEDEQDIYDLLLDIQKEARSYSKRLPEIIKDAFKNQNEQDEEINNPISMTHIEIYARENDTKFLSTIDRLKIEAISINKEKGNYSTEYYKEFYKWDKKQMNYFLVAFIGLCFAILILPLIIFIPALICGILCGQIAKKNKNLTQKGTNEQAKWKGLKKYMEDFSLLNEREVPELVLWEKYLVYATAFGIADKVISQLKVRYPEFTNEEYMMHSGYTYMYMMNRMNFDRILISSMNRAYSAGEAARASREYSSGGGRRRRILRRRPDGGGGRWSEWAEDKTKSFLGQNLESFFVF